MYEPIHGSAPDIAGKDIASEGDTVVGTNKMGDLVVSVLTGNK